MSDPGVGLRLMVFSCSVWVSGACACDLGDGDGAGVAEPRGAAQSRVPAGQPVPRATEQVVQRIVAAPARSASNGVQPAPDTAAPSPKGRVESITSRHLEAELNRLEAELGR